MFQCFFQCIFFLSLMIIVVVLPFFLSESVSRLPAKMIDEHSIEAHMMVLAATWHFLIT